MMNGTYILVIIPSLLYCSVMITQYYTSLITAWNLSFISFTYVKHLWLEFTSCNFSVLSFSCKGRLNINTEWRKKKKIIQHYCSRTSIALGDFFEVQKCLWQSRAPHQGAPYIKRTPWASDWKSTLTTSCKAFMQISPWPNHSVPGQERPNLWYGPGTVSYASGASQGVGSHCRLLRVASSQRAHRGTRERGACTGQGRTQNITQCFSLHARFQMPNGQIRMPAAPLHS